MPMDNNTKMTGKPLLSVVCVTYNHEKYIARAIDSFLMQKTSFSFEIVVGEDCSTDKTREICLEYQKKYPNKIRLIVSDKNVGPAGNFKRTLEAATGEYIAYCEGDDYWTDENKIQKQVGFLEENSDYFITSHNAQVVYEGTDKPSIEWLGRKREDTISLEDLLSYGSGGASCSLVFRSGIVKELPAWYWEQKGGDWSLQILCASKGKMKYFIEPMGVYRIHEKGSLSVRADEAKKNNLDLVAYNYGIVQDLTKALNEHFSYKYEKHLRKMNVYWYLYFIREGLKSGDAPAVKHYSWLAMKESFLTGFWNVPFVYPHLIITPLLLLLPSWMIRLIGDKLKR